MPEASDLYAELDLDDEAARYWRFRSLDIGGINDVIAERVGFDRGRISERQPAGPGEDTSGDGEGPSVQPDQQSGDTEPQQQAARSTEQSDSQLSGDQNA